VKEQLISTNYMRKQENCFMRLTKTQLKRLIKETLEETSFGLEQMTEEEGRPLYGDKPEPNKEIEELMQRSTDLYSQGGPEVKKQLTDLFEKAVEEWKAEQSQQIPEIPGIGEEI
jgi:hypothetical protein